MPPRCLGHSQCPCPKCTGLDKVTDLMYNNAKSASQQIQRLKAENEEMRDLIAYCCWVGIPIDLEDRAVKLIGTKEEFTEAVRSKMNG